MKDARIIYLVTDADGAVLEAAWGHDQDDAVRKVRGGVIAHPTSWRRVPPLVRGGTVIGDVVSGAGVRYILSDVGRSSRGVAEPLEPDAEVVDLDALAATAERLGRPIEVVERGTLRRVRALHALTKRDGAQDMDDAELIASNHGVDVVRRRANQGVSRLQSS